MKNVKFSKKRPVVSGIYIVNIENNPDSIYVEEYEDRIILASINIENEKLYINPMTNEGRDDGFVLDDSECEDITATFFGPINFV